MSSLSTLFLAIGCSVPHLTQAQFGSGIPIASGLTEVQELRAADLDGVNGIDIVVRQPNAIGWFANGGSGNFAPFDTIYMSQGEIGAFDLADVQADGFLDMMVADGGADAIVLLSNTGAGNFGSPLTVFGLEGALPQAIALEDILGNSSPDLVVNTGSQIQGFVNVDGDFGVPPVILTEGTFNQGLYVLDTDGDGDRDVVTFVGLSGALTTLINPGTMVAPWLNGSTFGHIMGGKRMRVVDVDGDGDLDLANATNHVMSWVDFEPGVDGIVAPQAVSGTTISLHRTGWTIPLGCGAGASMVWTDSISEPVQWTTYDPVLAGFGPVSVLPDLPSFQAIRSGDMDGDAKEDLILWYGGVNLSWYGNNILGSTQEVIISPFDTLCNAPVPYLLDHAQQAGGTWSGEGVEGDTFTPFGAGEFELFYTVLNELSGCPVSGSRSVEVIEVPMVISDSPLGDPCATGQIQLTGLPSGGAWSGAANAIGIIDNDTLTRPFQGGIYYAYTDVSGNTCEYGGMYQLQSYSTLAYTNPSPYCQGDDPVGFAVVGPLLGGLNVTGEGVMNVTYVPPVANVVFDPSAEGYHVIVITSISPFHCTTTVVDSILVSVCTGDGTISPDDGGLLVYPSPTVSGCVFIERGGPANVQFIDASGRLALTVTYHQPNAPIDIRTLESGLYTVIVWSLGQRSAGRVLVE